MPAAEGIQAEVVAAEAGITRNLARALDSSLLAESHFTQHPIWPESMSVMGDFAHRPRRVIWDVSPAVR